MIQIKHLETKERTAKVADFHHPGQIQPTLELTLSEATVYSE